MNLLIAIPYLIPGTASVHHALGHVSAHNPAICVEPNITKYCQTLSHGLVVHVGHHIRERFKASLLVFPNRDLRIGVRGGKGGDEVTAPRKKPRGILTFPGLLLRSFAFICACLFAGDRKKFPGPFFSQDKSSETCKLNSSGVPSKLYCLYHVPS